MVTIFFNTATIEECALRISARTNHPTIQPSRFQNSGEHGKVSTGKLKIVQSFSRRTEPPTISEGIGKCYEINNFREAEILLDKLS